MKWDDILFRTAVKAFRQRQRDQARTQRQRLKQAREDEKLRLKQARLAKRIPLDREIGSLTGEEFEAFVASLFEREEWRVSLTAQSGDMGIDINLSHVSDGRRAVVQCKKYKGSVGQPVIRDLYGVMTHVKADEGYVVTTGHFTPAAISFSRGKSIRLIDGEALWSWVQCHKSAETSCADHDSRSEQVSSPSMAHSQADRHAAPAKQREDSEVFLSAESEAFLRQMGDGFADLRELIGIIRATPAVHHVDSPQTVFSTAQAEQICKNHLAILESAVDSIDRLVRTGHTSMSEKTPTHYVQGHFEDIGKVLHRIEAGYSDVRSIATVGVRQSQIMQALAECYSSLLDDLDEFFAMAEHPGRMLLESPARALAEGVVIRTPDGEFRFTLTGSNDFPRAREALNRLGKQRRLSSPSTGAGCLAPVIALPCAMAAVAGILALALWG